MPETANFRRAFKKENEVLTCLLMEGEHLQIHRYVSQTWEQQAQNNHEDV